MGLVARALGWLAKTAGPTIVSGATTVGSKLGLGGLLKGAAAFIGIDLATRAGTGEGILGNIADAGGDAAQRIAEEGARASENAQNHGFGQRMINWANNLEGIPGIGNSAIMQFFSRLLRGWGEGIQDSTHDHEGPDVNPGVDMARDFAGAAAEGALYGASVGMVIPVVGPMFGAAAGAVAGVALDQDARHAAYNGFAGIFNRASAGLGFEARIEPIRGGPDVVPAPA